MVPEGSSQAILLAFEGKPLSFDGFSLAPTVILVIFAILFWGWVSFYVPSWL